MVDGNLMTWEFLTKFEESRENARNIPGWNCESDPVAL